MKKRLAAFLSALCLCLCSCAAPGDNLPGGSGIVLRKEEKAVYGDEETAAGKAFFDALFVGLAAGAEGGTLPAAAEAKIREASARAEAAFRAHAENSALPGEEYLALVARLDGDRGALIRASAAEEKTRAAKILCGWYVALSEAFDRAELAALLSELLIDDYDRRIADDLSHYEEYGYAYLAERAERLTGERSLLAGEIGAGTLGKVAGGWFLLCDLAVSDPAGADASEVFTDGEILLMLRAPELPDPLSDAAWTMLIRRGAEFCGEDALSTPEGAGALGKEMNSLCTLAERLRRELTPAEIGEIRSGSDAAAKVLAGRLTPEETATLERVRGALPEPGTGDSVFARIGERIGDVLKRTQREDTER